MTRTRSTRRKSRSRRRSRNTSRRRTKSRTRRYSRLSRGGYQTSRKLKRSRSNRRKTSRRSTMRRLTRKRSYSPRRRYKRKVKGGGNTNNANQGTTSVNTNSNNNNNGNNLNKYDLTKSVFKDFWLVDPTTEHKLRNDILDSSAFLSVSIGPGRTTPEDWEWKFIVHNDGSPYYGAAFDGNKRWMVRMVTKEKNGKWKRLKESDFKNLGLKGSMYLEKHIKKLEKLLENMPGLTGL